jgi:hypothetical protein
MVYTSLISVNYLATIIINKNEQGLCHFDNNIQTMACGSIVQLRTQPHSLKRLTNLLGWGR